jgi:hypothetical protein
VSNDNKKTPAKGADNRAAAVIARRYGVALALATLVAELAFQQIHKS